jgi:hypothetical protein
MDALVHTIGWLRFKKILSDSVDNGHHQREEGETKDSAKLGAKTSAERIF